MDRQEALLKLDKIESATTSTWIKLVGEKYFEEWRSMGFVSLSKGQTYTITDFGKIYCDELSFED